jgi:cytoskeletal protein CcmA (bactofilin family)
MGAALENPRRTGRTLIIDYAHNGDVMSAVVEIVQGGSVIGDVKARILNVSGRVDGNVEADELFIKRRDDETWGSVRGNVRARVLKVAGRVDGDIEADEVYIGKHAHIRGSVRYRTIGIAPGAVVAFASMHPLPSVVMAEEQAPAERREAPTRQVQPPAERRMKSLPSLFG